MSIRSSLADSFGQITDNGSVRVEKIVTGHAWLSGDTGRDDDNLSTGQGLLELFCLESFDLLG